MKKTPFILLKITLFLLTAIFFIGHNYVQAEEVPVRERLISIDKQDQDFTQALKAIADQAGINFNVHGQVPSGNRDLSLKDIPLDQAMTQILRMYGVSNHAVAYNPETGTVMLTFLGSQMIASKDLTENHKSVIDPPKKLQESNSTDPKDEILDEVLSPNIDAEAEEYHQKMKAKEQPEDYPEGLSQEEIDAIGRELMESVGN